MKKAALTGITGQTGSYLAELLLEKGYEVHGLIRRSSNFNTQRIDHVINRVKLHYGDLSDSNSIINFVSATKPDLFFNLGAMSHVKVSFEIPEYTFDVDATGVISCLEAIRIYSPETRFLQASTSELWGDQSPPHSEKTPFHPRSPYGAAKIAGYWATVNYREAYGMFAANSISHNHESSRRGETFVTRKITRAATRIKMGLQNELILGALQPKRDWSHAKDICEAMYLIATAEKSDDFVVSSDNSHSVQEFVELTFSKLGLDWKQYVKFDKKYLRPSEVPHLRGDSTKIRAQLGWQPKYTFEQLVNEMIEHDFKLAWREKFNDAVELPSNLLEGIK